MKDRALERDRPSQRKKSCSSKISAFVLIPASWFVSCVSLPVLFWLRSCGLLLAPARDLFLRLVWVILLRSCRFLLVPSWFVFGGCLPVLSLLRSDGFVFFAGARCLSAGHHLRLTRGPAGKRTIFVLTVLYLPSSWFV